MAGFGFDDLLSIPTFGAYTAQKQLGGYNLGEATGMGQTDDVGEMFKDFANVGKNKFQPTPAPVEDTYWGNDPGAAAAYFDMGKKGLAGSNADTSYASAMARDGGPQAWENQDLSNNEATSRGYHQEGALNLALQGALGNQPSEAAYQLQSGLDKSLAQQTAMAGGARGAGALSNAYGNMGASQANLQNQAFTEAGRLRAQEIADYSKMYGGLAGQQREQDLGRLNMGNQMSQFNAQNTTQRQLGFLGAANQGRQSGLGYYQQMPHGFDQQAQADMNTQNNKVGAYNTSLGLGASIAQGNADNAAAMRDRFMGFGTQLAQTGIGMGAGGAGGGGGPKPG